MNINKIKKELIAQKESKFKGNIYHYSQVNFSYNSNKIEGSRLTSDQTEAIFDTLSFIPRNDDLIKLDDLIESKNHFKLFDYMLDNVDEHLSKEMIIEMNKILKRNTSDEENPRYNVGGYKDGNEYITFMLSNVATSVGKGGGMTQGGKNQEMNMEPNGPGRRP